MAFRATGIGQNNPVNGLYDGEFFGFKVASPEELDAALREAIVAVDANVLLDLYRFRRQTSQDLLKTLTSLGDRLVVPNQALREFWRHRQHSQDSPRNATKTATDALNGTKGPMLRALKTWAEAVGVDDKELSNLSVRADKFINGLAKELQRALENASAEQGADQILAQLDEILAGRVTLPLGEEEWSKCVQEGKRRIDAKEPPGFMDAKKEQDNLPEGGKEQDNLPEGGAGDYLIWYQATRYAKERDRDLLIVTRDKKEDWWWRQRSNFLGPNPKLALEYHELTGKRLFLMRPAQLLERASVLEIEVDQASSADADRVAEIEERRSAAQGFVHPLTSAEYLRARFTSVLPEDAEIIEYASRFLIAAFDGGGRSRAAVDVGAGAGLYPSLLMLPWAERIVLTEYNSSNTGWLSQQLADTSVPWPWQQYWDLVAHLPYYRDVRDPQRRLAAAHEVRALSIFDLPPRTWDLGSMFFVADGITEDRKEFEAAVRAFLGALIPGSPFLMAFMEGSTGYDLHGAWFPSVRLTVQSLDALLADLPVTSTSVLRTDNTIRRLRFGYDAMLLVTGFVAD
jgi:hypothetical protein